MARRTVGLMECDTVVAPGMRRSNEGLAGKLWEAGQSNDTEAFLIMDIPFHRLDLSSSGKEMFAKLNTLVEAVLTTQYGLMPSQPHNEALQVHVDVASAIQRRNGDDAHTAMRAIMPARV